MLRPCDKQPTARASGIKDLDQRTLIFNKMFQHIKCAYDIKFALKNNPARIHLIQLHVGQTPLGIDQAVVKDFAAYEAHSWKVFAKSGEHETCPAANFEEAFGVWKVLTERPLDKCIPRAEPEICFLNTGETCEILGLESGAVVYGVVDELKYAVAKNWIITAPRACPIIAFEATFAH